MPSLYRHQLIILIAAGAVMFFNLGVPRLWDEDEPKNATCAREMFERGDWVVPTFNGELRTDKPILLYWLMLAAYHTFGVNEFSARFWSACCAIGTALLTYHMGRRMFSEQVGLIGGLLISTALMFVVAGRAATPDALLIFCITLSMYFFVRATFAVKQEPGVRGEPATAPTYGTPPTSLVDWLGIYSAMGLAVLAKGPVGVALPVAILGTYYLCIHTPYRAAAQASWQRRLLTPLVWFVQTFDPRRIVSDAIKMKPWLLVLAVSSIALPWYLLVGLRTDWAWPAGFLGVHNLGRFSAPMEGHDGSIFYYFGAIAVGFFPGSVFLVPMLLHARRQLASDDPRQRAFLFLTIWIAVFLLVFSFSGTKLPSYITPVYPALALLTAHFLHSTVLVPARVSRFWYRAALASFALVGIAMLFGLTYATQKYLPGKEYLALLGIIPFSAAVVCWYYFEHRRMAYATGTFLAAAALFSSSMFGVASVEVDQFQEATLIERGRNELGRIASYRTFRPSWVYYAGAPIARYKEPNQAAEYLTGGEGQALVTEERYLDELREELPFELEVVARQPRFLRDGTLVLVSRRAGNMVAGEVPEVRTAAQPGAERK